MIYSKGAAGFGLGDTATVGTSPSGTFNGQAGEVVAVDTKLTGDVTLKFKDGIVVTFWGEDLLLAKSEIEIPVDAIRAGDKFVREDGLVYWTALADSGLITTGSGPVVRVHVQFPDGGTQERFWDPGTILKVQR